jgi:hypothetical protein
MADKNPGAGKYYKRETNGRQVSENLPLASMHNNWARKFSGKTSPTELAKEMEDKDVTKLERLKKSIAASKAKKSSMTKGDSIPTGARRKSNSFVDIDDMLGNVQKYGRKFTGPKGSTGTSYTLPRKPKGKK